MSTSLYSPSTPEVRSAEDLVVLGLHAEPADEWTRSWSNSFGKRAFDVGASCGIILACAPLMAVIALGIRATSRGPVLFRQVRMGKNNVPFTIFKYRTMRVREMPGPLVTRKGDHRTTKIGRLLRISKLDELPQLLNVLRGEMSFVGPRPKVVEHERSMLTCKPGITGMATLFFSSEEELLTAIPEHHVEAFTVSVLHPIKSGIDRHYAVRCNFRSDLNILAATALRVGRKVAIRNLEELSETFSVSIDPYLQDLQPHQESEKL